MPDTSQLPKHPAQRRRGRLEPREAIANLRDQHVRAIEIRDAVEPAVVVRVRQDVAAAAGVVLRPRERVGDAEPDAARAASLDLRLQAVVSRLAGRLVERDAAESQIRPERVGVHARVPLNRARLQLVDVARALEVRRRAADVRQRCRASATAARDRPSRSTPTTSGLVKSGDCDAPHEREVACRGAARRVDVAVDDGLHLRQRRVEAVGRGRVDLHAVQEPADAGPERRQLVEGVGHPEPRLEAVLGRLGEAVRHAVIQPLQVGQLREFRERLVGRLVARKRDAVEAIAADHEAAGAIDHRRGRRVVELRLERRHRAVSSRPTAATASI